MCADTIKSNSKELTEFDVVGINMAKKMAKMDPLQAIYAESIINNVLRRGLLSKLTEDTNLCDGCRRIETPSSVQSYVSSVNSQYTAVPNANTYRSLTDTQVYPNSEAQEEASTDCLRSFYEQQSTLTLN